MTALDHRLHPIRLHSLIPLFHSLSKEAIWYRLRSERLLYCAKIQFIQIFLEISKNSSKITFLSQKEEFKSFTTDAVHAVIHIAEEVWCVWHWIVVRRQAQSTVARFLARVISYAGQEWIHLQSDRLLILTCYKILKTAKNKICKQFARRDKISSGCLILLEDECAVHSLDRKRRFPVDVVCTNRLHASADEYWCWMLGPYRLFGRSVWWLVGIVQLFFFSIQMKGINKHCKNKQINWIKKKERGRKREKKGKMIVWNWFS